MRINGTRKVGITGQSGFIGSYLFNYLGLKEEIERIPFTDDYFQDEASLENFVQSCDVIVHLAGMNRHNDQHVIYHTNMLLLKKLIAACENSNAKPYIIFSSSTQEQQDNLYGKSKRDGRLLLEAWALKSDAKVASLIIPNVFGPFGNPYHNSFIATFCHQLTHNKIPEIKVDSEMKLIFVGELVEVFFKLIINSSIHISHEIACTSINKVSEILKQLINYKATYFENGIMPDLSDPFNRNLFNTFVCYIDHASFFPFHLPVHSDARGSFFEIIKFNSGGQVSFSKTMPGMTRGNHFHTRKAERFTVIKGQGKIELRKVGTDKVMSFHLDGKNPSFIDMPIWHTHNIINTGDEELYTMFWISECYNHDDSDTFFEKV